MKEKAHGGDKTLSIQPSTIAGILKFHIGAIKTIASASSILFLWSRTVSSGFSPAKIGLKFSLYKSTQSTVCPSFFAVSIKYLLLLR